MTTIEVNDLLIRLQSMKKYLVLISRIAVLVKTVSEMEALDIFKFVKWKKYCEEETLNYNL